MGGVLGSMMGGSGAQKAAAAEQVKLSQEARAQAESQSIATIQDILRAQMAQSIRAYGRLGVDGRANATAVPAILSGLKV